MQFQSDGRIYKAVSITGPTHNYLGIEFAPDDGVDVQVEIEPLKLAPHEPDRLNTAEVSAKVIDGVREANEELGSSYRVQRITFVASDSPPTAIYHSLAKRIVRRLHERPSEFNGSDE